MNQRFASKTQRHRLYIIQDGQCALCQEELPDDFPVDHIVPFSQGGQTELWNLQGLCLECHQAKTCVDGSRLHP